MSHTTSLGIEIELEHLQMIERGFSALVEELSKDLSTSVSPSSIVALSALKEIAESGVRTAKMANSQITTITSSNQGH
jgi:hypothetical protein